MNGSLLIVGVIAVWIFLLIPGWSSAARWKLICIFLAELLGLYVLSRLVGLGLRLQANWDCGLAYRVQLRELMELFRAGTLAVPAVPPPEPFPWLFGGAVLLSLVILMLLFLYRHRKQLIPALLIPVLLIPVLLCCALFFEQQRSWIAFQKTQNRLMLVHIAEAALRAQEKGVPKQLISAVFAEQYALTRFTYENPYVCFLSGETACTVLNTLPERIAIQEAKEVLKYSECLYSSSPDRPEIKAVRILMEDARRNGVDELKRLFQTAGTNAGVLYAYVLLSHFESREKTVLHVLPGEVKVERNGVIETVSAKSFSAEPEQFRELLFSAWASGK